MVKDAPVGAAGDAGPGRGARAQRAQAPRRQVGHRLLRHPLPRLRLARPPLHLLRRLAQDLRRQAVAGGGRRHRRPALRQARRHRRRRRGRPGAGQQAGRAGPAHGRDARLPAALPALVPLLPQPRRLAAAADDRRPGDRRHLPDPAHRQRGRLDLDLRPQPDHGARAGPGDRLQPLHRLALPRGDRQGRAGAGGDATRAGDRRAHGVLLLADGRRGARLAARLPAALPLLDGPRRGAGGAVRGADLADGAAGGADPARHPGQLARAPLPAAPRRGRYAARRERLLVPALALRHAPAGAGRDDQRAAADRDGDPLLRDQVQHRRPDRAADVGQRPPGLRHGQRRVPALPRDADLDRRRRRRAGGGGAGRGPGRAGVPGVAEVNPPQRLERGRDRAPGRSPATPSSPRRARPR